MRTCLSAPPLFVECALIEITYHSDRAIVPAQISAAAFGLRRIATLADGWQVTVIGGDDCQVKKERAIVPVHRRPLPPLPCLLLALALIPHYGLTALGASLALADGWQPAHPRKSIITLAAPP